MNDDNAFLGGLPNEVSDETAYQLYTLAEQFVELVEHKYFYQIRRHIMTLQPTPPENLDLWEDNPDL